MSDFTYKNKKIILDGYYLEDSEIYCVDEDIEIENMLGIKQSVKRVNNTLVDVEEDNFTFTLNFIRKDNYNRIKAIDEAFLDEVNRIFFNKDRDYNVLEIGYYVYYVIPTEASLKRYDKNNAMFSITFESITPYRYSSIMQSNYVVDLTNTPKLISLTTDTVFNTCCDVSVKCIESGNLKIVNNKNGGAFISVDCVANEEFTIDSENTDVVGIEFSRVKGSIKDCLILRYGNNNIGIEVTGKFEIKFEYQEKFGLY